MKTTPDTKYTEELNGKTLTILITNKKLIILGALDISHHKLHDYTMFKTIQEHILKPFQDDASLPI